MSNWIHYNIRRYWIIRIDSYFHFKLTNPLSLFTTEWAQIVSLSILWLKINRDCLHEFCKVTEERTTILFTERKWDQLSLWKFSKFIVYNPVLFHPFSPKIFLFPILEAPNIQTNGKLRNLWLLWTKKSTFKFTLLSLLKIFGRIK